MKCKKFKGTGTKHRGVSFCGVDYRTEGRLTQSMLRPRTSNDVGRDGSNTNRIKGHQGVKSAAKAHTVGSMSGLAAALAAIMGVKTSARGRRPVL